jgi:hypothetical protein
MAADSNVTQDPDKPAEARQFDFWIGSWDIQQRILGADGGWLMFPGKTSVSSALGGAALIEHWHGTVQFFWEGMNSPSVMEGLSVRAFDEESGEWEIHWMDSRHPVFGKPYVGSFDDGVGTFLRDWQTEEGEKRWGRIRFSEIQPNSVRWELAISDDQDNGWSTLWVMEMTRREP